MTDPFRDLFCVAQRSAVSVAPFARIAHWVGPAQALLGAHAYAEAPVYVPAGCFYRLSTPAPRASEIEQALSEARSHGAAYVMYPCVRHDVDRSPLIASGFEPFPWFIESSCLRRGALEEQMREQLGGGRFRQVRRALRRYRDDYEAEIFVDEAAMRPLIREFDRLHQKNLAKYGHRLNFYESPVLDQLLASSLGERAFLLFSRDRRTGDRVQGLLGLLDPASNAMQLLVAGIDHDAVRAGHNIYLSVIFELYAWGATRGVDLFDLGRGKQLDKVRLGANRFYLLSNYVRGVDRPLHDDLRAIQRAARAKAADDLRALAAVMKDGYAFPTSCA